MNNRAIKLNICLIALYLVLPIQVQAQRLTFLQLEDSVKYLMEQQHLPALLVTVQNKDSIIWQTALGASNLRSHKAATIHHLFKIGSISKTFTALAIMHLIEAGQLSLETTLKSIVPEIPIDNPWEAERPIMIKDLLEHKAGFDDMHFSAFSKERDSTFSALDEVMVFENSFESRWRPGLIHSYSNPGYVLLAYIVEKISGNPYQAYVRENVFEPLGMSETFYCSELEQRKANHLISTGYYWEANGYQLAKDMKMVGEGAGAIMSNAVDMAKFAQYFLSDSMQNNSTLLSANAIKEMERLHGDLELINGETEGYSLGIYHRTFGTDKLSFLGHNGGINGFSSDFIYSDDMDISIVLSNNGEGNNRKIMNLLVDYYAIPVNKDQVNNYREVKDLAFFKKWEGTYRLLDSRNALYDFINYPFRTATITIKNDSLQVKRFMGEVEAYSYLGGNAFLAPNEQTASLYLNEVEDTYYVNYEGSLLGKVNGFMFVLLRVLLVIAVLVAVVSMLVFIIQLILWPFKKVKASHVLLSFLVTSVFLAFIISVKELLSNDSMEAMANLGTMGYSAILIFVCTTLMPLFGLVALLLIVKNWKQMNSKWSRFYYPITMTGAFILLMYCTFSGWLFMQLWNY